MVYRASCEEKTVESQRHPSGLPSFALRAKNRTRHPDDGSPGVRLCESLHTTVIPGPNLSDPINIAEVDVVQIYYCCSTVT
jgi:hypothetical protein